MPNHKGIVTIKPHEVWVFGAARGGFACTHIPEAAANLDAPVRYLHADLKCGECALQNEQLALSCPYGGNPTVNTRPACMAFVPKEGR